MLVDESLRDELARAITHPSKLLIEAAFQKQRAAKQALYDHHRTLLFEPIGRKAPQFCGPLGVLASSILPRHSVSPVVVHGAIREIVQLYYIGSAVREWQHVDRDGHVYGWECSISLYHIVSPSVGCQPCLVDVVPLLDKPNLAAIHRKLSLYDSIVDPLPAARPAPPATALISTSPLSKSPTTTITTVASKLPPSLSSSSSSVAAAAGEAASSFPPSTACSCIILALSCAESVEALAVELGFIVQRL